jgi:hypothetical protein
MDDQPKSTFYSILSANDLKNGCAHIDAQEGDVQRLLVDLADQQEHHNEEQMPGHAHGQQDQGVVGLAL